MLRIRTSAIINFLKKREDKYKKVLLHAPDGLRNQLFNIVEKISSETSVEAIISGERSFGSCDIPFYEAEKLKADLIIHIGHTPFPYSEESRLEFPMIPVKYFQVYDNRKVNKELYNYAKKILKPYKKVGVAFSIQYYKQFKYIISQLKDDGWIVEIGEPGFRMMKKGQVLGCHITSAKNISNKVEAFLIVSGGIFHALGVALWTGKPTYLMDIPANKVVDIDKEVRRIRAIIAYKIYEAEKAERFGVIVSTKIFQYNMRIARYIVNELRKRDKTAYLIILRDILPDNILYFPSIEAFIQTACPRISIDDLYTFSKPILNIEQFMILIGQKKFEEIYP